MPTFTLKSTSMGFIVKPGDRQLRLVIDEAEETLTLRFVGRDEYSTPLEFKCHADDIGGFDHLASFAQACMAADQLEVGEGAFGGALAASFLFAGVELLLQPHHPSKAEVRVRGYLPRDLGEHVTHEHFALRAKTADVQSFGRRLNRWLELHCKEDT